MAKRENVFVKIDYLSMIFQTIHVKEFIENVLQIPLTYFSVQDGKVKHKEYTKLYQYGNIKISGDCPPHEKNPDGVGCYLVLGGKGCDELQSCLQAQNKSFDSFFRDCHSYVGDGNYHFTRLDIAIDDKNTKPYFTIQQIQKKCLKEEFVSCCRTYRITESSFQEGTAKTVYIGNKKSNISFRFYDKDKEMSGRYNEPYDASKSWKRTEIQLRDETAHNFAMLIMEGTNDLGTLLFNLLGTTLRFVIKDKNQTNKSRWKTCPFWKKFLGTIEPLTLQSENKKSNLLQTQNWLEQGGAITAIKAFIFLQYHDALGDLNTIENMISCKSYSVSLCTNLVAHLQEIGREELIPLVYADTRGIDK